MFPMTQRIVTIDRIAVWKSQHTEDRDQASVRVGFKIEKLTGDELELLRHGSAVQALIDEQNATESKEGKDKPEISIDPSMTPTTIYKLTVGKSTIGTLTGDISGSGGARVVDSVATLRFVVVGTMDSDDVDTVARHVRNGDAKLTTEEKQASMDLDE